VEVGLIPNNNFRGANFGPSLTAHISAQYAWNQKISLRYQLGYARVLSSFGVFDSRTPFSAFKTAVFATRYLNNTISIDYAVIQREGINIGLNLGLMHQTLLKRNFDLLETTQPEDQRAFDMLNQLTNGITRQNMLYSYGIFVNLKRVRISLNLQRYFNNTFTSSFKFEGEEVTLRSNRKLYSLKLEYTLFNTND
jgi:hypothetical protein